MRLIKDRRYWALIAALSASVVALALPLAGTASAAEVGGVPVYRTCSFATNQPNYKGWANTAFRGCPIPGAAQTADCAAATAYRWTGSAWQAQYLNECSMGAAQVYVWPFASGWSWIWTQQTGWLAIQSRYVLISSSYGTTIGNLHTGH